MGRVGSSNNQDRGPDGVNRGKYGVNIGRTGKGIQKHTKNDHQKTFSDQKIANIKQEIKNQSLSSGANSSGGIVSEMSLSDTGAEQVGNLQKNIFGGGPEQMDVSENTNPMSLGDSLTQLQEALEHMLEPLGQALQDTQEINLEKKYTFIQDNKTCLFLPKARFDHVYKNLFTSIAQHLYNIKKSGEKNDQIYNFMSLFQLMPLFLPVFPKAQEGSNKYIFCVDQQSQEIVSSAEYFMNVLEQTWSLDMSLKEFNTLVQSAPPKVQGRLNRANGIGQYVRASIDESRLGEQEKISEKELGLLVYMGLAFEEICNNSLKEMEEPENKELFEKRNVDTGDLDGMGKDFKELLEQMSEGTYVINDIVEDVKASPDVFFEDILFFINNNVLNYTKIKQKWTEMPKK